MYVCMYVRMYVCSDSLSEVTAKLLDLCDCKLVAMTNGSEGSILANKHTVSCVDFID